MSERNIAPNDRQIALTLRAEEWELVIGALRGREEPESSFLANAISAHTGVDAAPLGSAEKTRLEERIDELKDEIKDIQDDRDEHERRADESESEVELLQDEIEVLKSKIEELKAKDDNE